MVILIQPPDPSTSNSRPEALQDMRQAWHGVRYLITDEISMVSIVILQHASKRLQEIKGMRGVPSGGLSVITSISSLQ